MKADNNANTKADPNDVDQAGKDAVKGDKTEKPVQLMRKGDYSIHILIEEVRNLIGKDKEAKVYPMVKITCLDKEKRTNKLDEGCFDYTFVEHFYFNRNNMSVEELDSEKIIIEVIDSKNTSREDYLGIYEFDFAYIYNNKDHAIHNHWIALANPESKDMTKVKGFLKLSISVLNEKDNRVELNYKSFDDPDTLCVVPPQVKMEYMQISIYLFKAEQLPDMDAIINPSKVNRECNGFIHAKYLGTEVKTTVKDMINDKIVWNEVMEIPVSVPVVSQRIVLQVWDKDTFSNDIVGSFELSVNDIMTNKYRDYQYIHIYGAPINRIGKYTDKMNANPEIGSLWKGRILMKVDYQKTDNPRRSCKPITNEAMLADVGRLGRPHQWFFDINLYDALFLPKESEKFAIHVAIEEHLYKFPLRKAEKRNIHYDLPTTLQLQTLTNNIKEVSDMFIYLANSSGDYICFQRIPTEVLLNNTDVLVVKLLPDPSIGKIEEFVYSGLVKIKINMRSKEVDFPLTSKISNGVDAISGVLSKTAQIFTGGSSKFPVSEGINLLEQTEPQPEESFEEEEGGLDSEFNKIKKEITVKTKDKKAEYMIVANIHMSRFLVSGDSDGTSDPYVKISIGTQEQKTTVKYDSVNCIWNESLYFLNIEMDLSDKTTWPILFLQVMDEDNFRDDMLAYNYIWLSDSSYQICSDMIPVLTPKWHQLHLPLSNRPQGQVLCSFFIIEMSNTNLINIAKNLEITPETELYHCEINVLGLRDLHPLSIMPVKKAFINFDMNSINVSGKEDKSLKSIKTQPKKCGPNPTINTVIKFDVKLPKDRIFMPELQCEVYDYVLAGLLNSTLGVFVIPLTDIIDQCHTKIDKDLRATQRKLGMLSGDVGNDQVDEELMQDDIALNLSVTSQNLKNSIKVKGEEKVKELSVDKEKARLLSNEGYAYNKGEVVLDVEKPVKSGMIQEANQEGNIKKAELPNINEKRDPKPELTPNKINPQSLPTTYNKSLPTIVKPIYKKYILPGNTPGSKNYKEFEIEDESQAPPYEIYESVGYNKYKQDDKKHYRLRFNCNLEDAKELGLRPPFFKIPIRRGRFIDKTEETGIFEAISNPHSKILKRFGNNGESKKPLKKHTEIARAKASVKYSHQIKMDEIALEEYNKFFDSKHYGDFKGLIRIVEKNKMREFESLVESISTKGEDLLQKDFKYLTNFEDLSKRILVEKEVVVRVYVLNLGDLAKKDLLSESDPYLKIYIAGQMINEMENAKEDKANCSWCKYYDFTTVLPGDGMLKLEVWDYDPLFSDELIGTTCIDLEDRYFDKTWRDLKEKPIEKRVLNHPDLEGSQGWVSMWVDVFEKQHRAEMKKWDISPPPTVELEMRLIVWETEGTPCMDVEGMSDYYVTCFIDANNKQSTDVHYRCEEGKKASFNWRIVLPISAPRDNTMINIQVMDNDIFSKDDYASGNVLNIQRLVKDVYALDVPIKFNQEFFKGLPEHDKRASDIEFIEKEKFWFNLYRQGDNGIEKGGRVLLSLEILPHWKAQICKVGKGRDEPNINPYLPPPIGRFQWSLNPFKMLNQCVGPEYRRKIYCLCCCSLVILYLIFVLPYIILHLSGEAVNPFNYIKSGKSG